jgi:TolA-binding protein
MVTLEQVKQLETKVARTVEYVERVSRENTQLQGKLDSYQKRIDELEVLIRKFKEDQGRIEDGILSALDRLNKFEDAIEKSIAPVQGSASPAARSPTPQKPPKPEPLPEAPVENEEIPEEPDAPEEPFIELLTEPLSEAPPDISTDDDEILPADAVPKGGPAAGELDIF